MPPPRESRRWASPSELPRESTDARRRRRWAREHWTARWSPSQGRPVRPARAALLRLAEAGATVVAADAHVARLAEAVDAARYAHGGATVTGETVDLLDLDATRAWADTHREGIRPDRRPGASRRRLARQRDLHRDRPRLTGTVLEKLLIRTVQHTSLAFHDGAAAQRPWPLSYWSARPVRPSHRGQRRVRGRQGRRRGVDAGAGRRLPQGRRRERADGPLRP